MNWHALTLIPGTELSVDTGSSVAFGSLSGNVDAAGLYYDTVGVNRVRLREYSVMAIPEPATMGLMALAGALMFARRRLSA